MGQKHLSPDGGRQQQHEGVDQLRFRKAHRRLYLNNSPEFFEIESDAEFQAYALGLRVHQAAATKEEGMTQCSGGTDDVQGSSTTTFCQFDGATCCDGGNFCCRRGSQCFSQATVMIEFVSYAFIIVILKDIGTTIISAFIAMLMTATNLIKTVGLDSSRVATMVLIY